MPGPSGGGGDALLQKKKEFLESFFRKGAEFTEELLRENEKLRYQVVKLEEEVAEARRENPSSATLKELVEKIHALEKERENLLERFARVEAQNREFQSRYQEIERENNNLANLYVAAYQLHSTLDLKEVLQIMVEILLNFVGAKTFAVYLRDQGDGLEPVAAVGVDPAQVPGHKLREGLIGEVAARGEAHYGRLDRQTSRVAEAPIVAIPLTLKERVVGVIAIWEMLAQKTQLADVDYELFKLLGDHAASALESARLQAERAGAEPLPLSAFKGFV